MIRINPAPLPSTTQDYLDSKQSEIDSKLTYAEQVAEGKSLWNSKSSTHFGSGQHIRKSLAESCTGLCRCQYCEDSFADEIEHIYPKDLYPNKIFHWENYLYTCGQCNGIYKNNKFAVFDSNEEVVDMTRSKNNQTSLPVSGDPLFIDIRNENPFDFFDLDFTTGAFTIKHEEDSYDYKRAEYTRNTIALNRDLLKKARQNKYKEFLSLITTYHKGKNKGKDTDEFIALKKIILESPHRTVWEVMKQYSTVEPEISDIFNSSPELNTIG